MLKLFGKTDRVFTSNGDIVIRPFKARVRKEISKGSIGDYYLDLECGNEYMNHIEEGRIIAVDLPQGVQAFRIGNPTYTPYKIQTRCWHSFYDTERYLVPSVNITNKNLDQALTELNNSSVPANDFTVSSDITDLNSYEAERVSLYEGIEGLLDRWGGYLVRDNFDIKILESIGVDNGEVIEYRKNLKSIQRDENWNDVVTKLLPVGKDGIMLNLVDPSADIFLESDIQYEIPYVKTITFAQNIEREDYPTEDAYKNALVNDLRQQGERYLEIYSLPEISYTIKANVDRITDVGDIIRVKDERLGTDILTQVTSWEYDAILEKYREVNFGTILKKLSDLRDVITKQVLREIGG